MKIGKYKILEEIGRGGMGTVYKGIDPALERPVAIKVLAAELSALPQFIRRFRREAESAAKLSHPNIVRIYDIGEEGNTYYLVMEYVDGKTLKQVMREVGKFQFEKVLEIVSQIASALDYAHECGIIHRDVKPKNILICSRTNRVKVADFGLALALEGLRLTARGQIFGTPGYMSPEQVLGKEVKVSSDIYSLGIITYEMLEGRLPFESETSIGVVYKQAYELPIPMRDSPKALESVLLKAMSKMSSHRHTSARAFVRALTEANRTQKEFLRKAGLPVMALFMTLSISLESSQGVSHLSHYTYPRLPGGQEQSGNTADEKLEIVAGFDSHMEAVKVPAQLYFQEGETLLQDGKYNKAKAKFGFVSEKYADTEWGRKAKNELIKLDLKMGEEAFSRHIRKLNTILQEADSLLNQGKYKEAKEKYVLLLDTEFTDRARSGFKKIRQEETKHYRMALISAEQGRIGKALRHFSLLSDERRQVDEKIREMGFVFIPAGEFVRRDETGKEKKVYLPAYYIERYEVTNASYKKFKPVHRFPSGYENHPVTEASWFDACSYAEWAGLELPTEEEWEKAAFGVDGRKYPWGNEFDNQHCNVGLNLSSAPVGNYPSGISPYGLYDMVGNVWEWVGSSSDGSSLWRIIRGASWNEVPVQRYVPLRASLGAEEKRRNVGFRCCWRVRD